MVCTAPASQRPEARIVPRIALVLARLGRTTDVNNAVERAAVMAETSGRRDMAAELRRRAFQFAQPAGATNPPPKP
jgi:hypothetical protein